MQSKAVASKVLTKWLAKRAEQWAEREGATDTDKVVAACVCAYDMAIKVMDQSPLVMTE